MGLVILSFTKGYTFCNYVALNYICPNNHVFIKKGNLLYLNSVTREKVYNGRELCAKPESK